MSTKTDVATALDELVERLRRDGSRVTTARRAVLEEFLRCREQHPSVEELAERIHRRYPDIHLSTVYRNLDHLEEAGVLAQVRVGNGPASYHLRSDAHDHAVCDRCGVVLLLPSAVMAELAELLDVELGFALSPSHVTLRGECDSCRRRQPTLRTK
jgi:Fe2+ or Zn2+ uptake regulation protein